MTVTIDTIREAAAAIAHGIEKTPCERSHTLSEITGADVILKFENHQFTGSYKDRGALFKLLSLTATQRAAGVVAMSAGNHAQSVAYHAQRLGVPATIVMPRSTPNVKVERTRAFGAEVVLRGTGLDESRAFMQDLARERGYEIVHPYDDEKVIAGQGTVALEIFETFPDLEVLIVPVGGGGLISGNAVAAKALSRHVEIIGVEAARFPSMLQVLRGMPVKCETSTIAEGIAVTEPGRLTVPIVRELVNDIVTAEEDEIEAAVLLLLEVEKTVVEGAGAVGLAAMLHDRERFRNRKVGLILSGGNIDLLILSSIIQRGLVRSGRLVRLIVGLPDLPGALAEVSRLLGESNANIIEVLHQRAFTNLSLRQVEVEFVVQTLGKDHIRRIVDMLEQANYSVRLPDGEITMPSS